MPYKHPKISYGLPTDSSPKELVKEYVEDLIMALDLTRKPVGVKLIFTEEDYNACNAPEVKGKIPYCCMVERATRGRHIKSKLEHHNCDGATTALALEDSTERIESGLEYFSYNLYSTPATARRMREQIVSLHRTGVKTCGVLVAPLAEMDVFPDVIILVVNPYQTMRVVQGYVYQYGKKPALNYGAMQAVCSEATVVPYMTGELNISCLCPSTRLLARWGDEEAVVGLPYEHLQHTVEGVIATINSTDVKRRKEEIIERFKQKGKELPLDLNSDYEGE
ncbi:MAG: DUF169 domain-containing protein [Firmicutes bacterium]|jgi:uncharacterized protein (DUF169 family)|nr:DUF169 domain-containing protein [Bacillota bacterium]